VTQLLHNKLTTTELAAELKRAPETIMRWRRLRVGPPFLRLQGRVLYDRQQVDAWLKAQQVGGAQ
jgi:hypothetical protein